MTQIKIVAICFLFSFLVACGGGGASVETTTTTMGQELMDLDESYKKGIISEGEYKDAKENIMDRYN